MSLATAPIAAPRRFDRVTLGVLSAGHLCADLSQGVVPAMLPFLVQERHLTYAAAAGLVLAQAISSSIVQPVFGRLSDRWSMAWLLPVGLALAGAGIAVATAVPTYTLMWLAIAVSGLGIAAFHPEGARYANYASGDRRTTGMSVFSVGGNMGFALGPFLATPLLLTLGLDRAWLLGLPALAMAAVAIAAQPRFGRVATSARIARAAAAGRPAPRGESAPAAAPGTDRWGPFARLTGALLGRSIVFYGLNTFIPLYWVGVLSQSKAVGGAVLTMMLLIGAIGTLAGGRLADRFSRRRVVLWAFTLLAPPLLLLALTGVPAVATIALVPIALALYVPSSVMVVMGQEYLPSQIGTASGVTLGLAVSVGGILTPAMGALGDHFGLRAVMLALVIVPVVAAGLVLSLPRERSR